MQPNNRDDVRSDLPDQIQRRRAASPKRASLLQELDSLVEAERTPTVTPGSASDSKDAMAAAAPKMDTMPVGAPVKSPGFLRETGRAIGGGVRDMATEVAQTLDDASAWLDHNIWNLRTGSEGFGQRGVLLGGKGLPEAASTDPKAKGALESKVDAALPKVAANETLPGQIGHNVVQFVSNFAVVLRAMRGIQTATKVGSAAKAMSAGAITDATAFDPHEARLSNFINEKAPSLRNPVTEYLAADPNDGKAEGRLKNALEGAVLGLGMEGAIKAGRSMDDLLTGLMAGFRAWKKTRAAAGKIEPPKGLGGLSPSPVSDKAPTNAIAKGNSKGNSKGSASGNAGAPSVPTEPKAPEVDFDAGKMPEPWQIDGAAPPRTGEVDLEGVLQDVAAGTSRRAYYDPEAGSVILSKERPEGKTVIDFDKRVEEAIGKSGFDRTAEDLIVLKAYQQQQEATIAAFRGEFKGSADAPPAPAKDDATRAISDAESRAVREQGDEIAIQIAENAKRLEEAAKAAPADPLSSGVSIGKQMEGGYASPTLLANLASALAGGVIGFNTPDEGASMEDRLYAAGMGSLAGLGVKVAVGRSVGRGVSEGVAERAAAKEAAKVAYASLAKHPSVAPIRAGQRSAAQVFQKSAAKITTERAGQMADDLAAGNAEALAKALDESDFNLDRIDTAEDVKELIDAFSTAFADKIKAAKRGTQSLADIEEHARQIGASVESLKALYKDTAGLAERITAHRILFTASAEKVNGLTKAMLQGEPDDATVIAFRKSVHLHAAIQAQEKGVQTEVARALSAYRIRATTLNLSVSEREALMNAIGGREANVELAKALDAVYDPAIKAAIARKSVAARGADALYEAWVNGILSGTGTHVLNVVGNSITGLLSVAERGMAAGIGAVRMNPERIKLQEVNAQVWGTFEGIKDAIRIKGAGGDIAKAMELYRKGDYQGAQAVIDQSDLGTAWKSVVTERSYTDPVLDARSLFDNQAPAPAISSGGLGWDPTSLRGRLADYLGAAYRAPAAKLLSGSDEFFKAATYRGELRAQAYRVATSEGKAGDARIARIADLLENPTRDMSDAAIRAARDVTFSAPLGTFGQSIQSVIAQSVVGKYIMPFVKTPTNILKYTGRRTPGINLLSEQWRNDFAAGGARRDQALAQVAMGTLMYTMAFQLKSNGLITGGGDIQKQAERASGVQQYSFKIGDTTYSYNRLDPFAMFLGMAADIADISGNVSEAEMGDLTVAAMTALKRNIYSKTYLKGALDLMLMIEDSSRYKPETWAGRFAASFIPWSSLVNQVDRMMEDDPVVREGWTFIDSYKARIPGLKDDIPPALNLLGEEVKMTDGWGPDWASPVRQMTANPSPLAKEIGEMNLDLRHPPRALATVTGAPDIDLTPKQYHRLVQLSGTWFKEQGEKLVTSDRYQKLPSVDEETDPKYITARQGVVRDLWRAALQQGRARLLQEDKDLMRKFIVIQQNAARQKAGLPLMPVE